MKSIVTKDDLSALPKVIAALVDSDARRAVKYLDPKRVVRATRRLFQGKVDSRGNIDITLTIGRPNYREREFISACKKAKEPFPVKAIILEYPPKKSSKKRK